MHSGELEGLDAGGTVEEGGVDRKRKRGDDGAPPSALQSPSSRDINPPGGVIKKIKSIHPLPAGSLPAASVHPHPLPIDLAEVAIRRPTFSANNIALPPIGHSSPPPEDVTMPAHDDPTQTTPAILEPPSPAPPETHVSPDEPLDLPDEPLDSSEEHGPPLQLPQAQPGFCTLYCVNNISRPV